MSAFVDELIRLREVEDHFNHGAAYPDTGGRVRPACCRTCAFRESAESVRPPGVTVAQVIQISDVMYDFVCHEPDAEGRHATCAGWAAAQRGSR